MSAFMVVLVVVGAIVGVPLAACILGLAAYLLSAVFMFGWYLGAELFAWMDEE